MLEIMVETAAETKIKIMKIAKIEANEQELRNSEFEEASFEKLFQGHRKCFRSTKMWHRMLRKMIRTVNVRPKKTKTNAVWCVKMLLSTSFENMDRRHVFQLKKPTLNKKHLKIRLSGCVNYMKIQRLVKKITFNQTKM